MTDDRFPVHRRDLLGAGLAFLAAPALIPGPALAATAPPGGRIAFDVYRKGKKIGEHVLTVSGGAGAVTMNAQVQMAVAIGPVTVFRYRHQQIEAWKGGRFATLETHTVQNGSHTQVEAERTDAGVKLEGGRPAGPRMLGAGALPLTHWNRASLSAPLFNPQDGKMMRLAITGQGPAKATLGGREITATRVALAGQTTIEDFYDAAGTWTGLRAKADDGSIIEYRKV